MVQPHRLTVHVMFFRYRYVFVGKANLGIRLFHLRVEFFECPRSGRLRRISQAHKQIPTAHKIRVDQLHQLPLALPPVDLLLGLLGCPPSARPLPGRHARHRAHGI